MQVGTKTDLVILISVLKFGVPPNLIFGDLEGAECPFLLVRVGTEGTVL